MGPNLQAIDTDINTGTPRVPGHQTKQCRKQ